MSFISYLINGISLGSVYALIALGYTMVYGIAKMLNFAHGDVIMVGAFITYTMCSTMGLSPVIGVLAAVVACTLLGMAIEKVAYKPLRKATSPLAVLITAIGVSYLLQNVALLIFGANAKAFTSVVSVPALKLADGQINITVNGSACHRQQCGAVSIAGDRFGHEYCPGLCTDRLRSYGSGRCSLCYHHFSGIIRCTVSDLYY